MYVYEMSSLPIETTGNKHNLQLHGNYTVQILHSFWVTLYYMETLESFWSIQKESLFTLDMLLKLKLGCWTKWTFEVCKKALKVYQSRPISVKAPVVQMSTRSPSLKLRLQHHPACSVQVFSCTHRGLLSCVHSEKKRQYVQNADDNNQNK